jgi:sugar phosphate isomerase/epimerase
LYAADDNARQRRLHLREGAVKLGTCLYNFIWDHPLPEAIEHAASFGFRAIEIMTTPPQLDARAFSAADADMVREVAERHGVQIISLNPTFIDLNLASRNDTFRRESVNEVKATIDVAVALGAAIVVVGPGRRHPLVLDPLEMSDRLAHPAIRECIDYAASKGIIYGFENITSLYMVRSEEIAEFIDKVDNPYCQAVYDVANGYYVEDPAAGIRTLGKRICHVHLSDTDGKVPAHWPVGHGAVDFAAVADALRDVGFDRWSMLETTWMDDPDGAVRSSMEALLPLGWDVETAAIGTPA